METNVAATKGITGVEFNTSSVSDLGTRVKVTSRFDYPFRAVVEVETQGFAASMGPFVRVVNNLLNLDINVTVRGRAASQWVTENFLPTQEVETRHVTDRNGRLVAVEYCNNLIGD